MSTIKDEAKKMIESLPDQANWDDIMYEIYVRKKIELGLQAARDGKVVTHEEVNAMFSRK